MLLGLSQSSAIPRLSYQCQAWLPESRIPDDYLHLPVSAVTVLLILSVGSLREISRPLARDAPRPPSRRLPRLSSSWTSSETSCHKIFVFVRRSYLYYPFFGDALFATAEYATCHEDPHLVAIGKAIPLVDEYLRTLTSMIQTSQAPHATAVAQITGAFSEGTDKLDDFFTGSFSLAFTLELVRKN